MIISCPSCHTKFRVSDARLKPGGQTVRCSKCGHLWRVSAEESKDSQAPEVSGSETPQASAVERRVEERPAASPVERQEQEEADNRREPVLTAEREPETDAGAQHGEPAPAGQQPAASKRDEPGADGLTEEQRARLHAARETQKKPRRGFRIMILLIFLIVGLLLLLALRMGGLRIPGLPQLSESIQGWNLEAPVREVGKVDAKTVPSGPATEGHIIGGDTPKQSGN